MRKRNEEFKRLRKKRKSLKQNRLYYYPMKLNIYEMKSKEKI